MMIIHGTLWAVNRQQKAREGRLMANKPLNTAKINKADEFYTQLTDIEAELRHYWEHFRGKVVFCNCDDPYESNFFKYFAMNFNFLGLKKLIATCYVNSPVEGTQLSLFDVVSLPREIREGKRPYKVEITEVPDANADGAVDLSDVEFLLKNEKNVLTMLNGDGDFRSRESVELLKQSDIVVTNPPFSLFREYVAQLVEYDKRFIIIGSKNAITYKEIFKLIKENRLWLGNSFSNGNAYFSIPKESARDFADGVYNPETGLVKFRNVGWFTNLDFPKRHENVTLFKQYRPEEYPRYVNYDAIEVSKVAEIPYDYDGEMGVPITFLDKYNPEQFEIIGSSRWLGEPMSKFAPKGSYVQGGIRFYLPLDTGGNNADNRSEQSRAEQSRAEQSRAEQSRAERNTGVYTTESSSGTKYQRLYDRIVIRHKVSPPV